MVRKGKYTRRVSPITKFKRSVRLNWRRFKSYSTKKKIAIIATPILAFLILTPLITYLYYYNDIADKERLMNRNNTGIVLLDKGGEAFYSSGRAEHRKQVPLEDISNNVEKALIASEDKDFYEHDGFSVSGIVRSVYNGLRAGEISGGGSTITQQLAKITLLSEDQNFLRKYQELAISIAIEQRYSKDEILDMYLNTAFFGGNIFGIEEAAKAYFNKAPKDLTLAESSMLIGILPAPNAYSPTLGNPKYAKERQETVLTRMVNNGFITDAQKKSAYGTKLTYAEMSLYGDSDAPHYVQMVLSELYDKYGGEEKVQRSGYQVKTTLDLNLQKRLKQNISSHLPYIESQGGSNAGGVAIDPRSGEIRALVGSADWNNKTWGKVNMAITPRQPGSSFKPIYYSKALADGVITPATIEADVPTDFGGYTPQNASLSFSGDITIRNALARSLNIPSVKVMQKLGIQKSIDAAKQLGITTIDDSKNYGLSLALGSAEAPLVEMTNAYAAFANQGQQYDTTLIRQINDKFNNNVFKATHTAKTAISKEGAFLISSILSDNVARAPIFGSSLTVPGHTVAVKTGTTDDQRDAWTIGYTPDLAIGVWVGNNNNEVMASGGSDMAGPIWVNTMSDMLNGKSDIPFAIPSSIVQRNVCISNGGLASSAGSGTYAEYFLAWKLPAATCTVPQKTQEKPKDTDKKIERDTPNKDEETDDVETPPIDDGTDEPDTGTQEPEDGDDDSGTGTAPGQTTPPVTP